MPGIDLEGLTGFAKMRDRAAPPLFVGRETVVKDIEDAAAFCWEAWRKGDTTPGATRVVSGAPGAGKSSLLMHLQRKWAETGGTAARMLLVDAPIRLSTPEALARELAQVLAPHLAKDILAEVSRSWQVQAGFSGVGVQAGGAPHRTAPLDPIDAVLARVPSRDWSGPLVLAVDEFQNVRGDKQSSEGGMLQLLHSQGYRAPIVPVLVGLGNTLDVANRLGVSPHSIESHRTLGGFSEVDAQDLVTGWGKKYGLPPGGAWEDVMLDEARRGSFWPAHVRNALAALAEAVVDAQGDMARVDMDAVRKRARARRHEYCAGRMSAEMKASSLLLGAVARDLRDGMQIHEVVNAIIRHADPASDDTGWLLPKGMGADDYYRQLVHRGVLQENGLAVTLPIPSLRSWIIEACAPDAAPASPATAVASALSDLPEPTPHDDPTDPCKT